MIDNASEVFSYGNTSTLQQASVPSPFGGLSIDRAVSFWDRTHRAVFTYYYELPLMRSQNGPLGRLLGGWALSGITAFESGVPYTVLNGQDADGRWQLLMIAPISIPLVAKVYAQCRVTPHPQVTEIQTQETSRSILERLAISGFPPIPAPTPRVRATSVATLSAHLEPRNFDVNVMKNIRMSEGVSLQFRAEFYNFFNTPQYGRVSESPFAPSQNLQTVSASVFNSPAGLFLDKTVPDGGGRVIRWQLRLNF